jgi:hypothetical protein
LVVYPVSLVLPYNHPFWQKTKISGVVQMHGSSATQAQLHLTPPVHPAIGALPCSRRNHIQHNAILLIFRIGLLRSVLRVPGNIVAPVVRQMCASPNRNKSNVPFSLTSVAQTSVNFSGLGLIITIPHG